MDNRLLLKRSLVYILVFALVSISYFNFNKQKESESKENNVEILESKSRALEIEDDYMEEEDPAVLGEIDLSEIDPDDEEENGEVIAENS